MCVAQLLLITDEIFSAKVLTPTNRLILKEYFSIFQRAFEKVWYKELIFKLQCYEIGSNLLKLLENYLKARKQRIVLNGQTSSWENILAVVPQGSIFGPILFWLHINDLPQGIVSTCKICADDTLLFSKFKDKKHSNLELSNDLHLISKWAFQLEMLFNCNPTK